jgi:MYXO-CTERM domain-containing protein
VDQGKSSVGHIKTDMMMPGAIAAFTVALRIPEGWSGKKTFWLRVKKVTSAANWVGAMANAAGVPADPEQPTANAAATDELCWALDDSGERLVLEQSGAKSNAAASGLFANDIRVESNAKLDTKVHDIDISYRLYDDYADNEMLDIIIRNGAHTLDRFKLTCAVYLDGAEEPYYVNLPYYDTQISNDTTQTITLPVSALVANPGEHSSAVVVISAVNREETALINNEFTLFLAGSEEEDEEDLVIEDQPEDITVQEGEDVYVPIKVQGGVKPYKYQWQVWDPRKEKWVDLPGFTGPVLSRKDVEGKWDGCRFRCVVTDAEGTQVVSKEFTLTVRDKVPTGDNSHLPLYLLIAMAALALLWWMRRRSRA